jgi:acetyl esterase/lipase
MSSTTIPPDDPARSLTLADPDHPGLRHLAVVGDTYTILVRGSDTAGRYTLIDMLIPDGGGPPPHRHDFEEMFHVSGAARPRPRSSMRMRSRSGCSGRWRRPRATASRTFDGVRARSPVGDEDLAYAGFLSRGGVPVEFHLRPGVPHEFDAAAPDTDVARRALEDRLRVLAGL